ncbi:hypothetical protein ACFPK9_03020 [Rubritalea spongiae]|uniref:Peptidase S8/S53 domain-containing protein n=1 Tax=Rubritalea spongiae TaxID=430797 RepID=A0ABW5E5Z7_9BACT
MRNYLFFSALPLVCSNIAYADWRDDISWEELQEWATLNSVTLPTSTALTVGISEAQTRKETYPGSGVYDYGYAPDPSYSQFSDESITDVSNIPMDIYSSHANGTASYFFGNTTSFMPSIGHANVYEAGNFAFSKLFSTPTSGWSESVMSHAWIGSSGSVNNTRFISAMLDQTTIDSSVLHIVGIKNGAQSLQSELLCHNYNNLSVGRSDGNHSYGSIPSGYEGADRQKPELVSPLGTTSASTAAIASMAIFLREHANTHSSLNAKLPVVLKSCILAGTNKEKLTDWENSSSEPIDDTFGAGEADILSSLRILNESESSTGAVGLRGWDYASILNQAQEYTITIPSYASSAKICANLSWNRNASYGNYSTLTDYSLTLKDSSDNVIFNSDSPVNNLEHVWQTGLQPGTYTLVVNKSNDTNLSTFYALAWRTEVETNNAHSTLTKTETLNQISFSNLAPEHSYILERNIDQTTWQEVSTLTSTVTGTLDYNDPNTSLGDQVFYRLRYFTP